MRTFWLIFLGAIIMLVILKIISQKDLTGSGIGSKFIKLSKTQQAMNLIRTNEFRELVKTSEFKSLASSLAEDQLVALSGALLNISK